MSGEFASYECHRRSWKRQQAKLGRRVEPFRIVTFQNARNDDESRWPAWTSEVNAKNKGSGDSRVFHSAEGKNATT